MRSVWAQDVSAGALDGVIRLAYKKVTPVNNTA